MGRKEIKAFGDDVRGKTIAVLGLTFKPNTDDMRDAPSIAVIRTLLDAGARVVAYDPEGMGAAKEVLGDIAHGTGVYETVEGADCLMRVTEWNAFRSLDFDRLRTLMKSPVPVDLHNVYRQFEVEAHGFAYHSVGRPMQGGDYAAEAAGGHLIGRLYEKTAIIVTTNLTFGEWPSVFGTPR